MATVIKTRIQQKHDIEANWINEAANFKPDKGEIIVYDIEVDKDGNHLALPEGRTIPYTYERFKIGNGKDVVGDLPFYSVDGHNHDSSYYTESEVDEKTKITGTVTKALGGIAKDKTYENANIVEVLSDLLFPYVAPTWSSLGLYNSAGASVTGTHEYGTEITVAKFKPTFTKGSKTINSLKVGTSNGGNDLYSGTTATSGTTYTLNTPKAYDGLTIGTNTIYCSVGDGTNSAGGSASISFAYYNYYAVTNNTTIPTQAASATNNGTSVEATITTTDNSYVWFLMLNQNKTTIQQYAMNQWNNMATTYEGTVSFKTSTNQTVTYHAYRTDKMMSASEKYRIN